MQQPNVVILMSDQHNKRFMSCAGHPVMRTPALDSLAARGVRFENAYCASPLCGPSRMSFMTGQQASRIGCMDNLRQLDSDTLTFAHMFGHCDYETVLAGRMHFNGFDQRHGFDKRLISDVLPTVFEDDAQAVAKLLNNGPWFPGTHANAIRRSGPGQCSYEQFDQQVAKAACQWIGERDLKENDRPFMLTVGFVLPHSPFVASEADFETYDKLVTEDDLPPWPDDLHPELKRYQDQSKLNDLPRVTAKDQRRARVAYLGMCASMDRQIQSVLDALDAKGLTENTIIVYVSDHGEQLGEHGLWWKNTFYEGSVGVPMIFAGPGIPKNQTRQQNVSLIDLGQTLLDMTGCKLNPTAQGRSFACLFDGDQEAWDDTVFADNLWPYTSECLHRMVKRGPWKLMHFEGHEPLLFHLDEDPGELNNRADDPSCAPIREQLMTLLRKDWDPQAIIAKQKSFSQSALLLRESRAKSDMPEPDIAWSDGITIDNFVDSSR